MTYDLDSKIIQIKAGLKAANEKLEKLEATASQAKGNKISESFNHRLTEMRVQKKLLTEHLSALEVEKAQSWQQSNFGNEMVNVAHQLLERVDKFLHSLSTLSK